MQLIRRSLARALALLAKPPNQALRKNAEQRIGKIERVHAQIEEAHDALGGAIGMQCREHQMAREGGLNANLGGFRIAHLAHHDDIRIGAQKRAHGRGKGEADFRIDLHLAQSGVHDFDRILGGPDLELRGVDVSQHGMQGCGLARSCRTTHQDHAVGASRENPHLRQIALGQAELFQRHRP